MRRRIWHQGTGVDLHVMIPTTLYVELQRRAEAAGRPIREEATRLLRAGLECQQKAVA